MRLAPGAAPIVILGGAKDLHFLEGRHRRPSPPVSSLRSSPPPLPQAVEGAFRTEIDPNPSTRRKPGSRVCRPMPCPWIPAFAGMTYGGESHAWQTPLARLRVVCQLLDTGGMEARSGCGSLQSR